jgi:hypothetical protein
MTAEAPDIAFGTDTSANPDGDGFWRRCGEVLLRPRQAFARLDDADAWFWPAILLLTGYTLYYLAIGVGMAHYQQEMMSRMLLKPLPGSKPVAVAATKWMLSVVPASQVLLGLLQVPFAIAASWAMRTTLFYLLARALGGAKPFWGRVVSMVGWAWLPLFIQYCLLGGVMLFVPAAFGFFVPLPASQDLSEAMSMAQEKWRLQALTSLSPFVLWNLALCILGVQEVFKLPRWKAVLVVAIPAVAQLLFEVGSHFFGMWMLSAFGGTPPTAPAPQPGR